MIKTQYIIKSDKVSTKESLIDDIVRARKITPEFLDTSIGLLTSYAQSIPNMCEAADLVCAHIKKGSSIIGICDYDCDGITSGSQIKLFMESIGYPKFKLITPDRHIDGYGVPQRIIDNEVFDLLITMDCGTIDKAVFRTREKDIDVVVLDHHECSDESLLAPANFIVNPKIHNEGLSFTEPCGSGLTFMFIISLRKALVAMGLNIPKLGLQYFALSSIGTIADMVPLRNVNRVIAYHGLDALNKISCGPLSVFKNGSGYGEKKINAGIIGFQLGPRINASGRIDHGCYPIEMFTTKDKEWCEDIAETLNYLNDLRKSETNEIVEMIQKRVFSGEFENQSSLVLASPKWPASIVGICASQVISSSFYGPTIVLQENKKKKLLKGSGRSVPGFDLYSALMKCDDLLDKWGGHEMAAGLTISKKKFAEFISRFENIVSETKIKNPDVFVKKIKVDAFLNFTEICNSMISSLQVFEPYGIGNPGIVLGTKNVKVIHSSRIVSKKSNLLGFKYKLAQNDNLPYFEAISWDTYATPLETIGYYSVYYKPTISAYNNSVCLDLVGWE